MERICLRGVLGLCGVAVAMMALAGPAGAQVPAGLQPAGAAAAVQAPAGAESPELAALEAELIKTDTQMRVLTSEIIKRHNPIREARIAALNTDKELQALSREISDKQALLEKRLLEKFPDIAAKVRESDKLKDEYAKLNARVLELRKKVAESKGIVAPIPESNAKK